MDAATIIRRVRALTGITRKELAELADIAPSTVGRIERGTLDPTWGTLSRILEASGYRISGDTLVSVGDPSAIMAAQRVLTPLFETSGADAGTQAAYAPMPAEAREWLARWTRAGWVSEKAGSDDIVTLAVSAGNAAKITRRNVARRRVAADQGWRELVGQLEGSGIDYAVSGLVATRDDRSIASSTAPIVYVSDPAQVEQDLGLRKAAPGEGVLLLESTDGVLGDVETEGGIRFVPRPRGVLDAFAGSGREPDKAEDVLRHLLKAAA